MAEQTLLYELSHFHLPTCKMQLQIRMPPLRDATHTQTYTRTERANWLNSLSMYLNIRFDIFN